MNEDVAAELGLNCTFETIKVNVLNGDCKSFQTMPVEFGLESVNGDVDIRVKALTVKRVTGNMKVIHRLITMSPSNRYHPPTPRSY